MNKNIYSYFYLALNVIVLAVFAYLIFMSAMLFYQPKVSSETVPLPKINETLYQSVSSSINLNSEIKIDNTGRVDPFTNY